MLITVAILSYNRPAELVRCINSLLPLPDDVELIIFDDKSPKIEEITDLLNPFLDNKNIKLHINYNNFGYDKNLFNAILNSSGEYVFLLSDDDMLETDTLDNVKSFLSKNIIEVGFVSYIDNNSIASKKYRYWISSIKFDENEINLNGSFIYNSILFSGLIFKKSSVNAISKKLEIFFDSIYIQVAIFAFLTSKFGAQYIHGPGVIVCSDGENGFGYNESSNNDDDLRDRTTIHSNIVFNKRLIAVVDMLSNHLGPKFLHNFFIEYNFRNISGLRYARAISRNDLISYWNSLNLITRDRKFYHYVVYLIMLLLPKFLVINVTNFFQNIISRIRSSHLNKRKFLQ